MYHNLNVIQSIFDDKYQVFNLDDFDPGFQGERPDTASLFMPESSRPEVLALLGNWGDDDTSYVKSKAAKVTTQAAAFAATPLHDPARFDAAMVWWEDGYNVVPLKPRQKYPNLDKWEFYEKRRVTDAEMKEWSHKFGFGCGVITGAISGIVVIDIDGPKAEAVISAFEELHRELPDTRVHRSGSGRGRHIFFKHPGGRIASSGLKSIEMDIKADGGFIVLPPSPHPDGGKYEVLNGAPLAELPDGLIDFIKAKTAAAAGVKVAKVPTKIEPAVDNGIGPIPEYMAKIFAECEGNVIPVSNLEPPTPDKMREILEYLNARQYFDEYFVYRDDPRNAQKITKVGWLNCAMALHSAYGEAGFDLWAIVHEDEKAIDTAPKYWAYICRKAPGARITVATLMRAAKDVGMVLTATAGPGNGYPGIGDNGGPKLDDDVRRLTDYWAYLPTGELIDTKTGILCAASSLDKVFNSITVDEVKMRSSVWLSRNQPIDKLTWLPKAPQIVKCKGRVTFNLYRAPLAEYGDADLAGPWVDHVIKLYPDDWSYMVLWFAHRVQHPNEKVNVAIVLGGGQGIGKDMLLRPVERAIGEWNVKSIAPTAFFGDFNYHMESVILKVDEAHNTGKESKYQLYDKMKTASAEASEMISINKKGAHPYEIKNCTGVIVTTNHKNDSLYIPEDDRRFFIAWSDLKRGEFPADYFEELGAWYKAGGYGHVAAYLTSLDLTGFNPKAEAPKTAAFLDVVNENRATFVDELSDAISMLTNPDAVTLTQIKGLSGIDEDFGTWLTDPANRIKITRRFEDCGYEKAKNPAAKDGRWKINAKSETIFVKKNLTKALQQAAAAALIKAETKTVVAGPKALQPPKQKGDPESGSKK